MKTIKILMLFLVFSFSSCGLFDDSNNVPSLDSGKDLEIYVGMPYEDSRKALEKFDCEDISQNVSYAHFNTGPFFKNCWFRFINSHIEIIGDKEKADDILKVTTLLICNSGDLRYYKAETWFSFDKLTVKDGRMKIDGLGNGIVYIGMNYQSAVEIIKKSGVTDIVEKDNQIHYKTEFKTCSFDDNGQPQFVKEYSMSVTVSFKENSVDKKVIESISMDWKYDPKHPDYSNSGNDVRCCIIDVKHPHGLQHGAKLID